MSALVSTIDIQPQIYGNAIKNHTKAHRSFLTGDRGRAVLV